MERVVDVGGAGGEEERVAELLSGASAFSGSARSRSECGARTWSARIEGQTGVRARTTSRTSRTSWAEAEVRRATP
jgi:hypothetical protein